MAETLHIRRARSTEYQRVAQLMNAAENSGVTVNALRDWDARLTPEDIFHRYVATLADAIIGYGVVYHSASVQDPHLLVWLTVDAACRRQGFGARFFDELARTACEFGATEFRSECRDDDPAGLAFATQRGFEIRRHFFYYARSPQLAHQFFFCNS